MAESGRELYGSCRDCSRRTEKDRTEDGNEQFSSACEIWSNGRRRLLYMQERRAIVPGIQ